MTQVPLKQAVRDHVESKKLTDAQYDALAMKINAAPTPPSKPERRWRMGAAIAAAVILAGVIALVLQSNNAPIEVQIADEVARNHIKLKPMEVSSGEMKDVRAFFVELDFVPIDSAVMARSGLGLKGGRYCSIQGVEAAQLRFENPSSGALRSVYMVPYDREKFGDLPVFEEGEAPVKQSARGLEVSIWVEQGVLLATAGPSEAATP